SDHPCFKWRLLPRFQGFHRLDVVMVINKQCLLRAVRLVVAEYHWLACGGKDAGIDTYLLHHSADHPGTFLDSIVLAGNTGLSHQASQLLDEPFPLGFDILIDGLQIDHFIFCHRHFSDYAPKTAKFTASSRSMLTHFASFLRELVPCSSIHPNLKDQYRR